MAGMEEPAAHGCSWLEPPDSEQLQTADCCCVSCVFQLENWKNKIKRAIPMGRFRIGSDGMMNLKPLEEGQEYLSMLGYVQKDQGKPHYKIFAKNVSKERLEEARRKYDVVATSWMTGRTKITRSNLALLVYGFNATQCAPMKGLLMRRGQLTAMRRRLG